MTENDNGHFAIYRLAATVSKRYLYGVSGSLHLLERGEDENGGFTHTGFSLTKDILTQNSLRNTLLLHYEAVSSNKEK